MARPSPLIKAITMKAQLMKLRTILLLTAISGIFISSVQAAKPVQLFNGKNLAGWQFYLDKHAVAKKDVWSVKDGLLVCKGEPLGYLYTVKTYESFKLVVEWRWAPGKEAGNSGVLMRIGGEPRPLPKCFEAQLKSGNAGAAYGFHGLSIDGAADRKIERESDFTGLMKGVNKIKANEKPVGEWNRYEIVFDGPDLTLWVNGEKVNEATACDVMPGHLGLQSEGGEIHFRKVELTPLD